MRISSLKEMFLNKNVISARKKKKKALLRVLALSLVLWTGALIRDSVKPPFHRLENADSSSSSVCLKSRKT